MPLIIPGGISTKYIVVVPVVDLGVAKEGVKVEAIKSTLKPKYP